MAEERFIFFITVVPILLSFSSQENFNHVSQHFREELGDEVTVRSVGKTRGIVDLDDKSIVKRIMCKDLKIKVSLNDVSAAKQWRAGDVVLGSSQHGCNLHSVHPDQPGIYAKILTKTEMNNNRVDLTVEPAKPLDIFEDAKISVHVKRNTEMFHSRHKRSASSQQSVADFLTKPLKSINWDKEVNTTLTFNLDKKVLALRKMPYHKVPEIIVKDKAEYVEAVDLEFEFSCYDCFGDTTIAYHLEMVIKKDANNEPNVKTYISQIEGRSSGYYNFSIHSTRELTLSHTAKLWETSPIRVDILPLSRFHQLPSIFLEVNSSSIASLSVYATTVEGNVTVSGTFSTEGDYVVSKEYYSPSSPPAQQVTVSNWRTDQGTNNKVLANTTFYYNVNVSQEIFIQPYINWAKKDVHLEFSSPFRIRFDQGIVASSKAIASAIQNEAISNITGYFDTSDNIVDVRAFGIQIWDVMMSKAEHQTETHITKHSLFSQSKANCFGDPTDLDSGYCGTPGPAILRTSDEFVNLKKIFGNVLILFTDDEYKTCKWCGQVGKQCTSCTEFEVDDERACADRLMTSSMATAITKLAKFVQAEWNNRKLVILDAWTEPTSQHPDGKYGNVTLYNEGRAARVGISKPLQSTPPSVEVDTDRAIFHRFKELLHCSGFPAAVIDTPDSVYEVCVAESQSYDRRKRKRRRRREVIANNTAISDDWQEEKERLTNIMIDLPEVIKYPDTLPDHLGFESIYPINETAESMCGASDEILRREHEKCMKKFFQYPFDNAEFEAEGPPSSWCGTETRQCKQCSHLSDSPDPMEWCETRIMSARLIVRIYRLSKYVEKKVVKRKMTTIEKSTGINVSHNWTDDEFAQCRNGPAYQSLSMKTCKDEMTLSEDKCTQCIKERRCCMSGCLQGDCQSGGVCNEKNPFKQDIPPSPSCDANDPWKVKLFDNTCTGDPCLFLNGAGIYVLMKVLMLYEVCSPLRNDSTMETWMADASSAYKSGISLMDFLRKCLDSSRINVLRIHGEKWDPHIGVGISLKGDNPSLMRKILNLTAKEYQDILENKRSITEKQALYLFGIVLRTKMKGLWGVIRYDELALLPTNVKIAIFNANYRGDFGKGVAAKFKRAVEKGNWEGAVSAYLSHTDYQENYRCLTKGTHDICKRYNFNAKQFRSMINKTITVGDSVGQRNSSLCSSPLWFESLRQAGRAAKISVRKSYTLTSKELANLAVEAGFDFVEMCEGSIYVCVKSACGTTTYIMQYPKLNLPSVCLPSEKEYQLPPHDNDTYSYPPLIDGGNQDLQLSDCYKIKDFRASNFRYFRLDTNLLECLDLASDYYGSCIDIVPDSGYRPHSLNNKNIGSRHQEERWRFNVGMAAEVRPIDNTAENLEQMALTIMRSCIPGLRLKRLKLGMGTHHDRVYIDIRTSDNCIDFFQLWDVDNSELHDSINETYQQLMKGGPFIQPTNKEKACKEPPLGNENFYIKHPTKGLCLFDFSASFCRDTQKHREEKAEELAEKLEAAAGSNQFPKQLAREKTKACLVDTCGGCVGKGHKWEKKTRACLDLIQTFLEKSTSPFPIDKMVDNTAFFNTENADSHVHSLACHDGSACIEDVQLHSIIIKIVNEKFKPDPSKSSEELIFDPGHNPTPLLDIVEQEMAMKASGNVSVYIEKDTDMSYFYHLIKILMVYNRNVGFVNFHITKDVKEDRIVGSIQKKIERWAQSSCPKRTRILVAPYDIQIVSESRRKRSIERSAERNLRIHNMRNWEMNWLMTMT